MATVAFNTSTWTSDQRTMVVAMAVTVLSGAAITYSGITRSQANGTLTLDVANPSADIVPVLTASALSSAYTSWRAAMDVAKAATDAESAEIDTALDIGPLKNVTLASALSGIDAITNLAGAKTYLRHLTTVVFALCRRTGTLRP